MAGENAAKNMAENASESASTLEVIKALEARLRRVEDVSAITHLIMTYGPSADAGLTKFAGDLWLKDGLYDWDADGEPYKGGAAVDAMLRGDGHQGLIAAGVAHFAGPPLIELDGDRATVLNYSLIMRREQDRHYLWRVSAVRWDIVRHGSGWRVQCRTNRLLDASGGGRRLFGTSLKELFDEA